MIRQEPSEVSLINGKAAFAGLSELDVKEGITETYTGHV